MSKYEMDQYYAYLEEAGVPTEHATLGGSFVGGVIKTIAVATLLYWSLASCVYIEDKIIRSENNPRQEEHEVIVREETKGEPYVFGIGEWKDYLSMDSCESFFADISSDGKIDKIKVQDMYRQCFQDGHRPTLESGSTDNYIRSFATRDALRLKKFTGIYPEDRKIKEWLDEIEPSDPEIKKWFEGGD